MTSISMVNVVFPEPFVIDTNSNIEKLTINCYMGTIRLIGTNISGLLTNLYSLSADLEIIKLQDEMKYNVKIRNTLISEDLKIYCWLKTLELNTVRDKITSHISVMSKCESMKLRNHSGVLNMQPNLCFEMVFFSRAEFGYSMNTNTLVLNGELRLNTFFLPRWIEHLELNGLIMNNFEVFHLHNDLSDIEICNCIGTFNFADTFNIGELSIEHKNVIKVNNLKGLRANVHFKCLMLNRSLTISDNVAWIELNNVIMENDTVMNALSGCELITISWSLCAINWPIIKEEDVMICPKSGLWGLMRCPEDDLFEFDLYNATLTEQFVMSSSVVKACLLNVKVLRNISVVVNKSCKDLQLENCTGAVICHSLKLFDTFSVTCFDYSALFVHFTESSDVTLEISYEFNCRIVLRIALRSNNLSSIFLERYSLNNKVAEVTNHNTCSSFALVPIAPEQFAHNIEYAYETKTTNIDPMIIWKEHISINKAHRRLFGSQEITQINVRSFPHN
ncbi:putative LRR containing protein [Trachipleistophora hominis]|uniref:Putative LRR containing protein n=1 Tax=Trachipleistophora hominis TaxID=72359 RepID=L7JRK4_TRAHO|nr:putative LRR containing protein [Trachipleistophora hominis]